MNAFGRCTTGSIANQDQLGVTLIFALGRRLGLSEGGLRDALATGILRQDTGGLPRRRAQRRQRNPVVLHQRRTVRGLLFYEDLAAAIEARLHAIVTR